MSFPNQLTADHLWAVAGNEELLEVGRKAVEDQLLYWRNERLSMLTRNNGCVIREANGEESSIIRFGPEVAISIALRAIAGHLNQKV